MSIHQHATIADTVYFWFAANDTSGSGADGASPVFYVRLAGAAAGAAPVLSDSGILLTHASYPAGAHEIAVAATVGNGFAAGNTYAVFCTLLVDSQNPTGFVGSVTLTPIISDVNEWLGTAVATPTVAGVPEIDLTHIMGTILTEGGAGRLSAAFIKLFDVVAPLLVASDVMRGTDSAALAATALTDATWTNAKAAFIDAAISGRAPASEYDTQLDANMSTRAPANEYDTQLDANMSTRSSHTAANVWAVGSRTLTSFGTLIADIWAYVTRTLTAVPSDGATETKQDLIQAEVNGLNGAAMRGTDGANTTVPDPAGTGAALAALIAVAQADLDTITGSDGATLATLQALYAPSKAGDLMGLIADAITSAKYDEATAFPVKSDDSGATQIARTGADGDTLETLSDQSDLVQAKTDNLPSGIAKNVALDDFEVLMVDSTDHVTGKTGLTVTAEISKDGGAFAGSSNSVTEVSDGVYKIDWIQAEMNVDTATFKFTAPGADQRTITIFTS